VPVQDASGPSYTGLGALLQLFGDQLTRIEQTSLNTFHQMFAPSISDMSQRSNLTTKACTDAYNPKGCPAEKLWCMVLGRYLDSSLIAAAHIYRRRWPVITAVSCCSHDMSCSQSNGVPAKRRDA